tara:strand:+ start:1146 stop:1442 length:297 start_codon:yes stop_codon:yes gene_type:complete
MVYILNKENQPLPKRIHVPNASGHVMVSGSFSGLGQLDGDTLQCCHCNAHFEVVEGREYGYCRKCNSPTCGSHRCDDCYPFEKKLDDIDKGRLGAEQL